MNHYDWPIKKQGAEISLLHSSLAGARQHLLRFLQASASKLIKYAGERNNFLS
jgi:hypothetical protein